MAIRWESHLSQAMQRHSGSVKDGAAQKPRPENDRTLPLVPEYGDPVWLLPRVRDEDAEREAALTTPA